MRAGRTTGKSWVRGITIYDITAQNGKLVAASGVIPLDDNRVNAHWYLWEGDKPEHPFVHKEAWLHRCQVQG